ncbi:MAG: agmatine deiminase family protein [Verrucomicrobia bacterium]|nr:agmatine deiminase family protein [Verrucomicrobiota bacterium]
MATPRDLGFRMPAEWEPQSATWLSWPSNPKLWPGHYDLVPAKFAEFAAAISRFQPVRINATGKLRAEAERELKAAKADLSVIELIDIATDDVWCRDHGPIFVKQRQTGEIALTDWDFHGWGGKFEASLDNQVPGKIAQHLGMKNFSFPFELEGGGIEVSGDGLLLTTEAVQNNPNRADGRDDAAFHTAIREGLAIDDLLWIGEGLANDDTDGHIDNLARFVSSRTLIAVTENDKASPNFKPLQENLRRLGEMRVKGGQKLDVIELPLPRTIRLAGRELPPSYANFLIVNDGVLVPVYGQDSDEKALGIIGDCFPGRKVVGLDCRLLLIEGGALHCLSQQQPA